MPFKYKNCDCTPLVFDREFDIENEDLLAEYVGTIVLGHYAHIKRIINSLSATEPKISDDEINLAISHLDYEGKSPNEIEKRDGWVFQIISWLVLLNENKDTKFYCQPPHDAPAQQGIDGLGIKFDENFKIENIIITEDKCTENQRTVINQQVWPEFENYEKGLFNNKIVNRISAMIENLDDGDVLEANKNDIYSTDKWIYRVGINRTDKYETDKKRKKLFKGYDDNVIGNDPHRRYAATINKADIRAWMEELSVKIITYLESLKGA